MANKITSQFVLEQATGNTCNREGGRDGENLNLNSKTLFYKDCSLGSDKNLSNNESLLSY